MVVHNLGCADSGVVVLSVCVSVLEIGIVLRIGGNEFSRGISICIIIPLTYFYSALATTEGRIPRTGAAGISCSVAERNVVTCTVHYFKVIKVVTNGTYLVVGNYRTVESPLFAEDLGHKRIVLRAGYYADAVEACHNAASITHRNCVLIRTEIDLTDRLLVCPGTNVVSVGLLVVKSHVLDVRIYASGGNACDYICGDETCMYAVLRVVLEVTSGERAAVGVHRRSVPAVVAVPHTFFTEQIALLTSKLLVPGCGKHLCGAPVTST